MRLRDYCQDHARQAVLFLVGLALFCFGVWLDPNQHVQVATLLYLAALAIVIATGGAWWHYRRKRQWLQAFQDRLAANAGALDWPLPPGRTHEQAVITAAYNHLLKQHQASQAQLLTRQQDQKAFIDSWVHEIKVPLAATQLLVDSLDGQAPEAPLDELALQLDRIDHYVEQVLYYARLDSFSRDYLLHEHRLTPLVDSVVASLRNSFIANHIRFSLSGPDARVVTDDKWLRFILMQLFSNALKYTPAGGQITATLATTQQEVTLAIQDTGIGIPVDEQHRVFEKGFTGTNGRTANQKSTGLGLYLAQQLSAKLGHTLTLTATPGVGTTVTIHFTNLSYYGESGATLTKPVLPQEASHHDL
ncbi:sensor histidine kinase [Lacticaseibacillus daqingensis]|uniref:sensor histidine kinase n=1 Tax=Lacticaseibacillus daqingensis TaxID=2486014 RepID=UPI000F78F198|nr:HAMP domain-containing sensor histidine kinase [Lacticaseibacillus daqingensis]